MVDRIAAIILGLALAGLLFSIFGLVMSIALGGRF